MIKRTIYDYSEWNPDLDVMDEAVFLADPPEYVLPEWDPIPAIDWTDTHDWTNDYDFPDHYDYYEDDND